MIPDHHKHHIHGIAKNIIGICGDIACSEDRNHDLARDVVHNMISGIYGLGVKSIEGISPCRPVDIPPLQKERHKMLADNLFPAMSFAVKKDDKAIGVLHDNLIRHLAEHVYPAGQNAGRAQRMAEILESIASQHTPDSPAFTGNQAWAR